MSVFQSVRTILLQLHDPVRPMSEDGEVGFSKLLTSAGLTISQDSSVDAGKARFYDARDACSIHIICHAALPKDIVKCKCMIAVLLLLLLVLLLCCHIKCLFGPGMQVPKGQELLPQSYALLVRLKDPRAVCTRIQGLSPYGDVYTRSSFPGRGAARLKGPLWNIHCRVSDDRDLSFSRRPLLPR